MTVPASPLTTLTVTIPWTPPRILSPNASRRVHFGTKTKARNAAKRVAHDATLDALQNLAADVALPWLVPYRVVVAWGKGRQRMDDDNLIASLKAAQDGVCATIEIDDRDLRLTGITQERDPAGIGSTTFIFGEEN